MEVIAHIHTELPAKFGLPRQSGVVKSLKGRIVFTPKYRNADALRGMEEFSYLWLIWLFSEVKNDGAWSPTVRPPRLGGNVRKGVFATRSPFRPNPIGLSSVKIERIDLHTADGPVIEVSGVDLMDGTPILDIKPYLAYCDAHPDAGDGFAAGVMDLQLQVEADEALLQVFDASQRRTLIDLLAQDPRPHYQNEPHRIYGFTFSGHEVRFQVEGRLLRVVGVD